VAAVSQFLYESGANILTSDQYSSDPEGGSLFLRMSFRLPGVTETRAALEKAFSNVARQFAMEWQLSYGADSRRVAVMVSRDDHCLMDLIWRWRRGELPAELTMVISNHVDLKDAVRAFGLPYCHWLPASTLPAARKPPWLPTPGSNRRSGSPWTFGCQARAPELRREPATHLAARPHPCAQRKVIGGRARAGEYCPPMAERTPEPIAKAAGR